MNQTLTAEERQLINDVLDDLFKNELWSKKKRLEEFRAYLIDGDSLKEFRENFPGYNSLLEFCKKYKKEEDQPINIMNLSSQMNLSMMYGVWNVTYLPPTDKSQAEIDRAVSLFEKYKNTPLKDLIKPTKHKKK